MSKATTKKSSGSQASGIERRRTKRRPILSTFSLFVVVPQKGFHRLMVHDVSEEGIGFDLDTEGEDAESFPLKSGETLELHLYLNQSLYLPLSVRIMRLEDRNQIRRIGAELVAKGKGYEAYAAFIQMLDKIIDVGQIQPS